MKKKIIIVSAVVAVILFAGAFLFIGSMRKSAVERERLYLLSRIWKDAYEQNSLWEFVPDLDWDECYAEYTSKVLDCKSDYDFYMLLDEFIANLQDRQFQLKFPDDSEVVPLPVYIEKIEDRYFISEVRISARTIPNKSEVLEVNSTPIDLYLQKSFGDSKSTEANYNNALNKLNYYQKKGSSVELSIVTPEGETKQETLTCVGENTALAASARIDRMNNLNIVKIYTYSKFTAYQLENDIFIIEGTESDQNSDIIRDLEKFLNSPVDGSFTPVIEKAMGTSLI